MSPSSISTLLSGSETSPFSTSPTRATQSKEGSLRGRSFQQELEESISSHVARQVTLDEFWTSLCCDSSEFAQEPLPEFTNPKNDFSDFMSRICTDILKEYGHPAEKLISFRSTHSFSMKGKSRDKVDQPDFIACTLSAYTEPEIHQWSGIDAVVEIAPRHHRRGTHAITHTIQLLEARPDLISAFGMYVDDCGIVLIIASPSGVVLSPKLSPSIEGETQLLYAFIKCLYRPHSLMVDPTIRRRQDPSTKSWVFDIALSLPGRAEPLHCTGYSLLDSRRGIGERSHIFCNTDNPLVIDGKPMPIVKDYYRHPDSVQSEAQVLHHIHSEGAIPGVVEMLYSAEEVLRPDGSSISAGSLVKTRIGLRQYGKSFMDIKTPREALMAIYDLLEVTRILFSSRRVVHRDISDGNLLLHPPVAGLPSLQGRVDTFVPSRQIQRCFIRYLLNQADDPLYTTTLLIDFGQSTIFGDDSEAIPKQRLGTRRFMARALLRDGLPACPPLTGWNPPPNLLSPAGDVYARMYPDRIQRFSSSPDHPCIRTTNRKSEPDPHHHLWHEAESAFWLLFWWAVRAQPNTDTGSSIPAVTWGLFNSSASAERRTCGIADGALDPAYKPLEDFLYDMGQLIQPDLQWAKEAPYTDPDFLHETMQRSIVNFLVDNDGAGFMDIPKSTGPRIYKPSHAFIKYQHLI